MQSMLDRLQGCTSRYLVELLSYPNGHRRSRKRHHRGGGCKRWYRDSSSLYWVYCSWSDWLGRSRRRGSWFGRDRILGGVMGRTSQEGRDEDSRDKSEGLPEELQTRIEHSKLGSLSVTIALAAFVGLMPSLSFAIVGQVAHFSDLSVRSNLANGASFWYAVGVIVSLILFECVRVVWPSSDPSGLKPSQFIDIGAGIVLGLLVVFHPTASTLCGAVGFGAIAAVDYAIRWYAVFGERKKGVGRMS